LLGYLWAWLENQVSAAMKTVPLGQLSGQRILATLSAALPGLVAAALRMEDDELSNCAPGLAIASSRHETQYSRLFRS
jgi:urease accessory protein